MASWQHICLWLLSFLRRTHRLHGGGSDLSRKDLPPRQKSQVPSVSPVQPTDTPWHVHGLKPQLAAF